MTFNEVLYSSNKHVRFIAHLYLILILLYQSFNAYCNLDEVPGIVEKCELVLYLDGSVCL